MRGRRPLWAVIAAGLAIVGAGFARAASIGPATARVGADRVAPPARSFSLIAVGDWLSEGRVNGAAAAWAPEGVRYDHGPLLGPVAATIASANLAICHMETPIGWPGAPAGFIGRASTGTSLIAAPFEVAADLRRAGFDRCSTASNHSYDAGVGGIDSTLAVLDAAGITHTGTARTPAEAAVDVVDVDGVAVGHVAYALNSNVGFPADDWRIRRLRDETTVRRDVDAARAAGAEVVVVSIHVYVEMRSAPAAADRALVEAITSSGRIDLVLIHGPHVVQPMEIVNGTPVFWSLGNFVSGMGVPGRGKYSDLRTLDGVMAAVRFTERDDGSFASVAAPILLCQMVDTRVVYQGLAPAPSEAVSARLAECRDRTASVMVGLR